jgi:aspartyl-tRNA(Asn)/glutamyl-tRNA(Gln) amidotransferase subunit A
MPPFAMGERLDDPLSMYLADIFTISTNLAGVPGMAVPCGTTADGLPLAFQLMAPAFEEGRLFRMGRAWEMATTTI